MNETMKQYGDKRLIHLTKEQEERMAAQSVQKIQAFVGEAAQVQGRRCEVMVALLTAHVTKKGIRSLQPKDIEACRQAAHIAVEADCRQKFSDLKSLFKELGITGPQPHLEWAAKQVGVTLFDLPPPTPIVQPVTVQDASKVIQ